MNSSNIIIVLSLTIYSTFVFGQKFRQKKYNIFNRVKILESYRTLNGIVTTTRCAGRCIDDDRCISANYNGASHECELTHYSPEDGSVNIIDDQNWKIIFIKNRK